MGEVDDNGVLFDFGAVVGDCAMYRGKAAGGGGLM